MEGEKVKVFMQKIILVGYGNVGKEIEKVLRANGVAIDLIVKSDNAQEYLKNLDDQTVVFISVPSRGDGSEMLHYYTEALNRGTHIVTCEKAILANHWELIKRHPEKIRYSATVGGDSGILPAIRNFQDEIREIRAVVNGTLNYIAQEFAKGSPKEVVYADVIKKGFAEPCSRDFDEIIKNELKDVAYKAAILANHSRLCSPASPVDISTQGFKDREGCVVEIQKGNVEIKFVSRKDTGWFPPDADNVLYINGEKIVEGPGAGGRATALRMFKDFKTL